MSGPEYCPAFASPEDWTDRLLSELGAAYLFGDIVDWRMSEENPEAMHVGPTLQHVSTVRHWCQRRWTEPRFEPDGAQQYLDLTAAGREALGR